MAVQSELKTILDSLNEPRLLIRNDFSVAYANRAFLHRYGQQDYEGRPCYELVFHLNKRCSACGEVCPLEQSLITKQNEETFRRQNTMSGSRFVEVSTVPVVRSDGVPSYFMETVRDSEGMVEQLERVGLVTRSKAVKKLLSKIAQLVPLDVPVLFVGETGSGKEVFAKVLHENSRRAAQAFLRMECLTLTEEKLAREINRAFGTGLTGGTLYLTDVAELSHEMQASILQFLKTGRYFVAGNEGGEKADIRVIFGTRRELKPLVERGLFNEELFYRLAISRLDVPNLKDRQEDIPELCELILAESVSGRQQKLSSAALKELQQREWSGNVAELSAVLNRVSIFCHSDTIELVDVLSEIGYVNARVGSGDKALSEQLNDEQYLRERLETWHGSRKDLAKELGISVRTLYRQIQKLGTTLNESGS